MMMVNVEMTKLKVLVTSTKTPESGLKLLQERYEVTVLEGLSPSRENLLKKVVGQDAIFLSGHQKIDAEVLNAAGPQLKVISTMSAGYDFLDVKEIKKRGIKIGHTPEVLSSAVAEVAVMLLLSAARRAHNNRLQMEIGQISDDPMCLMGLDVRGSTVGIVGLGSIGIAIARRLVPFEVEHFLYTGHHPKKVAEEISAEFVSLNILLQRSDFIIVATPLTDETRGLFDDSAFNKMKKTAIFINIGRGAVVKTDALVKALREKKIFAAGLDVVDPEPLPKNHELLSFPNVEIVPHIGSATFKTRNDMSLVAAQNILNAFDGKPLVYSV